MIVRVKGIKRYRVGGKWYIYHRATKTRVEAEPGTPEFFAEIDRLNGVIREPKSGTLGGLIKAYRASPEFLEIADRTRKDYQAVFDWLQRIDMTPIVEIDSSLVIALRDKAYLKRKRRFANYVVQVMSLLYTWGKPRLKLESNPAADIPKIKRPRNMPAANRPWGADEIATVLEDFRQTPTLLTGLALGIYAGLTEADAVTFPWSSYAGGYLVFDRGKTGAPVHLPAHRELRAILDPLPKKSTVIMVNQADAPYTVSGFRGMFFKRIKRLEKAGSVRPGLTFHGLRHTMGTMLADAGASDREIQAVLGHKTAAMAQHYTRGANRKSAGKSAVVKLERKRKKSV